MAGDLSGVKYVAGKKVVEAKPVKIVKCPLLNASECLAEDCGFYFTERMQCAVLVLARSFAKA